MGDCKNHLCVIFQTSNNHILCGGETVPAFVRKPAKGQWPPPFTLSLFSALALWVITRSRKSGGHRGFISPLECAQMVGITANEVLKQINNYQVEFWGQFCPSSMADWVWERWLCSVSPSCGVFLKDWLLAATGWTEVGHLYSESCINVSKSKPAELEFRDFFSQALLTGVTQTCHPESIPTVLKFNVFFLFSFFYSSIFHGIHMCVGVKMNAVYLSWWM